MASDDEDYVGSGSKYDSLQLDPEDPKPSLLERKDAEKRTSSPSIKSDMPKPRFERGQTLYCYDGPDLYPVSLTVQLGPTLDGPDPNNPIKIFDRRNV